MNIFYLDKNPVKAAEMSCDKHVVKMILESAQMLSTAHRVIDGEEYFDKTANGRKIRRWRLKDKDKENTIYKAGWLNHPSTKWVMDSAYNYWWLYQHMMALNEEYKKRYNHTKDHLCIQKLKDVLRYPPKKANVKKPGYDATPAMPDECKVPGDSVASYRKYYIMKKQRFATWKSPSVMPTWFKQGVENVTSI